MAIFLFSDNGTSTLAANIGPSATSITLAPGDGAKFPTPAAGQLFTLTLNDAATHLQFETTYCTHRAGDVLTVTRGQEGTTAQSWVIGDQAFNGPTSGTMQNILQIPHITDGSLSPIVNNLTVGGSETIGGNLGVAGTVSSVGVVIPWSASFPGGYPRGAIVQSATVLGRFWVSTADNNTTNPDTGGANWLSVIPVGANPTATAGPNAINGSAVTFMRSDAAPAVQTATTGQKGLVEPDGTTITISSGVISAVGVGHNPTATAGPTAVNGSAVTFMRSDAAPAVRLATTGQTGLVQPDGTTIGISGGVIFSLGRIRLTADLNIFVATTGSDTANTGLTIGSPFATTQHAWNIIVKNYDMNGFNINVNVADGVYSSGALCFGALVGNGTVNFIGNVITPPNVLISVTNQHCFVAGAGASITLAGFKLEATGTGSVGLAACALLSSQSTVGIVNNMEFGHCDGFHIYASAGSNVGISTAGYEISGGAQAHFLSDTGAPISANTNVSIIISGTPAFSTAFAYANLTGVISMPTPTMSFFGGSTGLRYLANLNGVIATNGGGPNYFPGTVAGTVAAGGQYS
jgi:hypothetical protein